MIDTSVLYSYNVLIRTV